MKRPRRKYGKFQVADADCKARFGGIIVSIFNLQHTNPKIEYNKRKEEVPQEIVQAVKMWVKHNKFAGLSLTEYLNLLFKASDYP